MRTKAQRSDVNFRCCYSVVLFSDFFLYVCLTDLPHAFWFTFVPSSVIGLLTVSYRFKPQHAVMTLVRWKRIPHGERNRTKTDFRSIELLYWEVRLGSLLNAYHLLNVCD